MTTNRRRFSDTLEALVHQSCDNAVENGYDLFSWNPREIAIDAATYDADLEQIEIVDLIPLIESWFAKHGRTPPEADPRIIQGHDHYEEIQ